jgi:cyclically-permuted mutarotase family protein
MFFCCVNPLRATTESTLQWSKLTAMPPGVGQKEQPGVAGPFVGVHNDALIIAGGANFPGKPVWDNGTKVYHDDVFVLTKDEHGDIQWHKGFKLPSPLAYGVAISTAGGIVCIGGRDDKQAETDAFIMRWHPTNRSISFEPLPSLPSAVSNMDGAIIDDTIYIAGGVVDGAESNQLLSLDLSGGSEWAELPDFPGPPRKQLVAAAQNTKQGRQLFIFSGLSYRTKDDEPFVATDGYRYDPATTKWTAIAPISPADSGPIAVCGGAAIGCGKHHILVFGGRGSQNLAWILKIMRARLQAKELQNNREFQRLDRIIYGYFTETEFHFNDKVLAYNTLTDEWAVLGRHPFVPVTNTRAVFWDGGIVLASGERQPGVRISQIFRMRVPEQYAGNGELTVVAFGSNKEAWRHKRLAQYAGAMRTVAAELDVPLIDIYEHFEQHGDGTPQARHTLLLDGVHPNDKGHAIVAKQIAELIRLLVASGKMCER